MEISYIATAGSGANIPEHEESPSNNSLWLEHANAQYIHITFMGSELRSMIFELFLKFQHIRETNLNNSVMLTAFAHQSLENHIK